MTLQSQFITVLTMVGIGAGMGAIFDAYRVLSAQLRVPRWMIPLLDIVYWIVSTLLVFRGLYASNHGQVRLYVFLGLIAGGWLYMQFLSNPFTRLVELIINAVKKIIQFLIQTIEIVVIKPIIALYKLIIIILGFLLALTVFLYKIVLQLLYPFWFVASKLFGLIQPWLKFLKPKWMNALWPKWMKLWNRILKKP